ncbi:MAG: hypothetical protein HY313_08215 [Acidobacteria bacterium]|nr:hypothetical protein [Acidobacteriota bacterium]
MSERNGDKARFDRARRRKIIRRQRVRELRKLLGLGRHPLETKTGGGRT